MLAAVALASALALTATACESGDTDASGDSSATAAADDGKLKIPDDIADRLKEHGIDLDKWRDGAWKNWDKDKWLREAQDFVNPIIEGLWDPDRMRDADEPDQPEVDENDISGDQGVTDPTPKPVQAKAVPTTYHENAPTAGKVFFDSPRARWSAPRRWCRTRPTPASPTWCGRRATVCMRARRAAGTATSPSCPRTTTRACRAQEVGGAAKEEVAPYGIWWGDWAQTSDQWIEQGGATGGDGAPYDFAVIHVTPEKGGDGKSLEETVGSAMPVDFDAPAVPKIEEMTAIGYPAAPPYDGQSLYSCEDKPGRLSLSASDPTMYRIGCTMTAGSSGGGWIAAGQDGEPALVSNTSIGPVTTGWLAGPRLGKEAKGVYDAVSEKFAGQ